MTGIGKLQRLVPKIKDDINCRHIHAMSAVGNEVVVQLSKNHCRRLIRTDSQPEVADGAYHQESSGNAFACHVPDDKTKAIGIQFHKIKEIPADYSCRNIF